MARRKTRREPLGTIWEMSDPLRERILPILKEFWPRKATGRPPARWRRTLDGIIFRMRTGCQWSEWPARYGPRSTVRGRSQRWAAGGVLEEIWAVLVAPSATNSAPERHDRAGSPGFVCRRGERFDEYKG